MMRSCIMAILLAALTPGCKTSQSELADLEAQTTRHPICGVERHKEREHRLCGEIFKAKRTKHCGVEKYKSLPSYSCKGSRREQSQRVYGWSPKCPAGWTKVREKDVYEYRTDDRREGSGVRHRVRVNHYAECVLPKILKSCRRSQHGVERYKSCRHRHHGHERWKKCEHASFGSVYKKCEFYKTPEQAVEFADNVDIFAEHARDNLITHKGNFYSFANSEPSLAQFISAYDNDPLFAGPIAELKTKYQITFGRAYDPMTARELIADSQQISIDKYECENTESAMCRSKNGYIHAKNWFVGNMKDLATLIDNLSGLKYEKEAEYITSVSEKVSALFRGLVKAEEPKADE